MSKSSRWLARGLTSGLAIGVIAGGAYAAGFLTNGLPLAGQAPYPTTLPLTGNEIFPADTGLPSGQQPQSEGIGSGQLAGLTAPAGLGRNFLDNGDMLISARGTGAVTGGTTSGCAVLSYVADRWCVDTNVGSGAGKAQVITASPAPPGGFTNSVKVWRDSGALLQPIMYQQEIKTSRAMMLAGKSVIGSCYVQPLAAFTATTNLTMQVITGTGSDQGLGALRSAVGMTASPALTPVWTGLATVAMAPGAGSPSWNLGTTAVWSRIYSAPVALASTVTEAAFQIGFTPVGSSSGATDGFAVTGCQLEIANGNQNAPSSFEFKAPALSLLEAQKFYFQIKETNGGYYGSGIASATNVQTVIVQAPSGPMDILPVLATTAGGLSYRDNGSALAVTSPALSAASTATTTGALTITDSSTQTVGHTAPLYGTATTGLLTFSADY